MSHRHRLAVGLAVVGGAVAIAACGTGASSYSASGSAQSSSNRTAFVNFSKCMRSNGVPNFPDPSSGGGLELGPGMNPFSPAFKAAQGKCRKLLPGGGPPTGPPSAKAMNQALQTSECMRRHGISGFPDPTTKQPSSPAGYSAIQDDGGVILAIPSTINPQSPAFQAASKACQFG